MGNGTQASFTSAEQLQKEADSLVADILFAQLANEKIQKRVLDITETVLLGDNNQGKVKRWVKTRMVNMMPRIFSIMNNRLGSENGNLPADLGRFLSLQLKIQNKNKENTGNGDNAAAAREVAEKIDTFLSNVDFGDIYKRVEGTGDALVERTDIIKTTILENHTGKMAVLAPVMVELLNNMLGVTNLIASDHKDMPPDFIADFAAGLINMIDGAMVGKILNNNYEMSRLLSTGNKLQREGEATLFELAFQNKALEIMKEIDPVTFMKMKNGKAELKEAVQKGQLQALANYPELIKKFLEAEALVENAENRTLIRKLELVSKLSDEDLAEGISGYINAKSAVDTAETANLFITVLGKVQETCPGLVGGYIANLLSSVDTDDLAAICGPVIQEVLASAGPVLAPVMPQLINGICDTFEKSMDENPDEMPKALSRLASIFNNGGEK